MTETQGWLVTEHGQDGASVCGLVNTDLAEWREPAGQPVCEACFRTAGTE